MRKHPIEIQARYAGRTAQVGERAIELTDLVIEPTPIALRRIRNVLQNDTDLLLRKCANDRFYIRFDLWDRHARLQIVHANHQKDDLWSSPDDFIQSVQHARAGVARDSAIEKSHAGQKLMPIDSFRVG